MCSYNDDDDDDDEEEEEEEAKGKLKGFESCLCMELLLMLLKLLFSRGSSEG